MKPIPEIITNVGWKYYEKCRCGGILKYKFRHEQKPGLTLEWFVLYAKFRIVERNKLKVPATALSKLEDVWKTL
jgi:hypothetical protein